MTEADETLSEDEKARDAWWDRTSPRERTAWAAWVGGSTMAEAWEAKKRYGDTLVWLPDGAPPDERQDDPSFYHPLRLAERIKLGVFAAVALALSLAFYIGIAILLKNAVFPTKSATAEPRPVGHAAAQAIARGAERSRAVFNRIAEEKLQSDERTAGAAWALAHHLTRADQCPGGTVPFVEGCANAMRGTRKVG